MTKILFIGDGYPVGTDAGSVLYKKVIKSYGISSFCYYGLGHKTNLEWPEEFQKMPKKNSSLRIRGAGRIVKYIKKIPFIDELFYFLILPVISRKVKFFVLRYNVKLIIAVFRADVLAIINKIDRKNKIPLLGFISDTIEAEHNDKPIIYWYKRREYLKAINNALGIYVAGESMNEYIKSNFNKVTSILRLGYEPNITTERTIDKNTKEIKIFFSGSVYAIEEFELFLNALSILSMKYPEYEIIFTTATTYSIKSKFEGIHIINLGWVAEKELIKKMQDAHIGYVPYKFDEKSVTQMTYAFPNKTGFYLSTGLPIFFHGPEYSSMSKLFEKYPCGIHCSSMDQSVVVTHLEKLLFDNEFYHKCLLAGIEAFTEEFSLNVMTDNFKKLIDKTGYNEN
jgi:glycosyltransferase involved in cell wall biosynthesis